MKNREQEAVASYKEYCMSMSPLYYFSVTLCDIFGSQCLVHKWNQYDYCKEDMKKVLECTWYTVKAYANSVYCISLTLKVDIIVIKES